MPRVVSLNTDAAVVMVVRKAVDKAGAAAPPLSEWVDPVLPSRFNGFVRIRCPTSFVMYSPTLSASP